MKVLKSNTFFIYPIRIHTLKCCTQTVNGKFINQAYEALQNLIVNHVES